MLFYRGCIFGSLVSLLLWVVILVVLYADEMTVRSTLSAAGLICALLIGLCVLVVVMPLPPGESDK